MSKADAAVDALMGKAALDSRVFGFSARSASGRAKHIHRNLGTHLKVAMKNDMLRRSLQSFFVVDLLGYFFEV